MAAKRLVPLLALGLTLVGVPAAHAATHATVSYSSSTGFDVEDLDGQKNDIHLTIDPPFSGDAAASLTFEEVAKDSADATFPLQAGAGCSQFQENFQPQPSKVLGNPPQSGS